MELISFEKTGQIGILKFNRPQALNALNRALLEELEGFLSEGVKSQKIRALAVTGAGKAFVAGADIKEMQAFDTEGIRRFCELGQRITNLLDNLPMITIAAVNGFALGGGLEIALACDFIYASSHAKLGLPEVSLGVIPGFGGTQRLLRAVGVRRAKELIATGRPLGAEEALRVGLVNKVVAPEKLMEEVINTAKVILQNSFSAVSRAKRSVNEGAGLDLAKALAVEKEYFVDSFSKADRAEGMAAFIEKRAPEFA